MSCCTPLGVPPKSLPKLELPNNPESSWHLPWHKFWKCCVTMKSHTSTPHIQSGKYRREKALFLLLHFVEMINFLQTTAEAALRYNPPCWVTQVHSYANSEQQRWTCQGNVVCFSAISLGVLPGPSLSIVRASLLQSHSLFQLVSPILLTFFCTTQALLHSSSFPLHSSPGTATMHYTGQPIHRANSDGWQPDSNLLRAHFNKQ